MSVVKTLKKLAEQKLVLALTAFPVGLHEEAERLEDETLRRRVALAGDRVLARKLACNL